MALAEEITYENRNMREQDSALTTYSTATFGGVPYVQLQSYGTAGERVSQTMQFNRRSAEQLVEILTKTFGL